MEFDFETYRVEVSKKLEHGVRIFKADILGGITVFNFNLTLGGRPPVRVAYTPEAGFQMPAVGKARLFEEPQSMNVMDMLKNPMVLMMLMLLFSTTILPKLTPSPEQLAVCLFPPHS